MRFFSSASAFRGIVLIALAVITPITFTGCGSTAFSNNAASTTKAPTAAMLMQTPSVPPVLVFNGAGTSSSDVAAVETVLKNLGLGYATVNSSELDTMTVSKLLSYRLFIVPGGNSITIGSNLTKTATTNVHNAVYSGLHYLGICAGAFFGGYSIYNGLNLTNGVWFNLYSNSTSPEVMDVYFPNGNVYDIYWQYGPELAGWGSVVGRYPNGKPAITEGKFGSGWVLLSGVHPEAPSNWRYGMNFATSLSTDLAYASKLVTYALNGWSLPHY